MKSQSRISANTLFHFTSSKEYLVDILIHTFHPRYCPEDIPILGKEYEKDDIPNHAFPMTCFCDIPLSQISDHAEKYGNYAIGLSKDWGIKNGINPILYTIPNTTLANSIKDLVDSLLDLPATSSIVEAKNQLKSYQNLICLACFSKNYEGRQFKNGEYKGEKINFYNEKEWRYVPTMKVMDTIMKKSKIAVAMPGNIFTNNETVKEWNKVLREECNIPFTPNDIKYIIVKSEEEIVPMFEEVMRIKAQFSDEEKKLLTTRIISMENIREDF